MVKPSLLDIFRQMIEGSLPFFWIRPLEEDREFEDFAGEHGIRKINLWQGMYLKRVTPFNLTVPARGLIFVEVKTLNDLRDWLKVVNMEIMSNRELSLISFLNVLHHPDFKFFRVIRGEKTLSAILMHKRNTETGIYMVSTEFNERGKGIGRWITASAIDLLFVDGCRDFVLHSTPSGFPVYQRLGFKECCEYGIFWMFGKK